MKEQPPINLIEGNMPDIFIEPVRPQQPTEMRPRQWYVPDVVQQYRMRREMRRITDSGRKAGK